MRSRTLRRLSGVAVAMVVATAFAPVANAYAYAGSAGAGTIEVQVLGCRGPALPGATVELVNIDNAQVVATVRTDEQGAAAFASLPYGLYQLRARAEGYAEVASVLVPVVESTPNSTVRLEMQGEQCSCDPDSPDYDKDCKCPDGSTVGVIAAAAGFTFLGLSGGAAIAALIGVVGAAVGGGIAIANAVSEEATP